RRGSRRQGDPRAPRRRPPPRRLGTVERPPAFRTPAARQSGLVARLHDRPLPPTLTAAPARRLAGDPASLGDVDLLTVRPAVLDLVVRAGARARAAVAHVGPIRHGIGPRLVELAASLVDVVHHEAEVMDAAVSGNVARALAVAVVLGLEDRQVDVAVGEVTAGPRLADFLQAEHVLVEGR